MLSFFKKKKEKQNKRSVEMKSVINAQVKIRNEYYTSLIVDICSSRACISKDNVLLKATEYNGYYSLDESSWTGILVLWNSDIKCLLIQQGIDSWKDSNDDLIIQLSNKK